MNSNFNPHLTLAALVIIALVQILAFASSSTNNNRGLETEEKTRLGSTPPSCHNKCNECHPCLAVQVPTLPTHDRLKPNAAGPSSSSSSLMGFYQQGPGNADRYSNYKPLGWKCRCNNHFYNP